MDEKIKNIIDERMEVWGYLKSRYTGKMEEMLVIYQETCKAIISENINTAKDNRMGIIREERKGIPIVSKTVPVPKKAEQKNLNSVKDKRESGVATQKQIKFIKDIMVRSEEYATLVSDFLIDNNVPLDNISSHDANFLIKKMKI